MLLCGWGLCAALEFVFLSGFIFRLSLSEQRGRSTATSAGFSRNRTVTDVLCEGWLREEELVDNAEG